MEYHFVRVFLASTEIHIRSMMAKRETSNNRSLSFLNDFLSLSLSFFLSLFVCACDERISHPLPDGFGAARFFARERIFVDG